MIVFRIKEIRKNKNITAYQLSKQVGITRAYLSELENGKRLNPTIKVLSDIAEALEVNIKDLFYTELDINDLKEEMYRRIDEYGLDSNEAMEISRIIDLLINIEMRKL